MKKTNKRHPVSFKDGLVILIISVGMQLGCNPQHSEQLSTAAVASAVESFRVVMLNPDQRIFETILGESLSYGHSNGLIEDRSACIASMLTGKFKFSSLTFSEQTIAIVGNTAIVRHIMSGDTADAGKDPGTIKLHVLQVWIKKDKVWQLIARQAARI